MFFSVTNRGEWICWGCDPDRAHLPRGIALRVAVLFLKGRPTAANFGEIEQALARADAMAAIGASRFEHCGQEWIGWEAEGWGYAARTFKLPIDDLELWIRRTHGLGWCPDEDDFRRGSRLPEVGGIYVAWWILAGD